MMLKEEVQQSTKVVPCTCDKMPRGFCQALEHYPRPKNPLLEGNRKERRKIKALMKDKTA